MINPIYIHSLRISAFSGGEFMSFHFLLVGLARKLNYSSYGMARSGAIFLCYFPLDSNCS